MTKSNITTIINDMISGAKKEQPDKNVWIETLIERENGFYIQLGFETGENYRSEQSYGEIIKEAKIDYISFPFLKNGDLEDLDCKIRELFDKIDLDRE